MGQKIFWTIFFLTNNFCSTKFMVIMVNYKNNQIQQHKQHTNQWVLTPKQLYLVSAFIYLILTKLVLWGHLRQLISGTATFVQVTFVLVTITITMRGEPCSYFISSSLFSQFSPSSTRILFSNLEFIRNGQPLLKTCRPYSTLVGQC